MASDARDQLAEHLKFFAELGVSGYSKDPAWQSREQRAESKEQVRRAGLAPQPEARPALVTTMPDDLAAIRFHGFLREDDVVARDDPGRGRGGLQLFVCAGVSV